MRFLLVFYAALAAAKNNRGQIKYRLKTHPLEPSQPPADDIISSSTVSLVRQAGIPNSKRYIDAVQRILRIDAGGSPNDAPLTTYGGQVYMAEIQFGDQLPFHAVIDTGSSDTWAARSDFQCLTTSGRNAPPESCGFGRLQEASSTFREIPDRKFNISYMDGEQLNGAIGWENVTFAGVSFNQTIGLVDEACWFGDGVSSGLIGLAFSSLTSSYNESESRNTIPYSPIFTTMHTEKHVAPMFSLALSRPTANASEHVEGGWLTFGGLPSRVRYKAPFAAANLEMLAMHSDDLNAPPEYQFFTINIDGYAYIGSKAVPLNPGRVDKRPPPVRDNTTLDSRRHVIIDSGTTLIYTPPEVAAAVNALFDPPAQMTLFSSVYKVRCDAKPPKFGVYISGKMFSVSPKDMILKGEDVDMCTTGVQPMHGMSVLGDVFLRNVLAVFDVGAGEMRFAARA